MKSAMNNAMKEAANVAPLVGAWIEIWGIMIMLQRKPSLPSWERGLKYVTPASVCQAERVAPLVGAWIEIKVLQNLLSAYTRRSPRGSVD